MKAFLKTLLLLYSTVFLQRLAPAQDAFTALNGITGGKIRFLEINPTTGRVYANDSQDGRIYTTDNNGQTWQQGKANISDLIVDGNKLHYVDYGSFYTSTDGGQTWARMNPNSPFQDGMSLNKLPVNGEVFLVYGCSGVYISTDAGVNWKKISSHSPCGFSTFEAAFTNDGDVYFTSPDAPGILRHEFPTDGVWDASKVTTVFPKLISGNDFALTVAVTTTGKILITHSNAANDAHLMSASTTGNAGSWTAFTSPPASEAWRADGGNTYATSPAGKLYTTHGSLYWELTNETSQTWTLKNSPHGQYSGQTITSLVWKNATEAYVGVDGPGVFRTTDGGVTWSQVNGTPPNAIMSPNASDIEVLANGNLLLLEEGGMKGVWTSADQGATFVWRPQAFTFYGASWQQKLCKLQDNSILAQTSDGTQRSVDGITWTKQTNTNYSTYLPVGTNEIYGIGHEGLGFGKSTDLGVTWTPITVSGLPASYWVQFAVRTSNNFFLAIVNRATEKEEYWKLDTSTTPWNATLMVTPLRSNGWSCVGFFEMGGKIYASDGEKIAITATQGADWATINFTHSAMVPIRQGAGGFAISSNASFFVTQDEGKTWRNITIPGTYSSVRDIAQDAGGNFYATVTAGPAGKYNGNLILPANELPPAVNVSWQPLAGGPFGGEVRRLYKTDAGQFFAMGLESIFKANATAQRWDRLPITNQLYYIRDAVVDNAGKIYEIISYEMRYSSDGGTTWTRPPGTFYEGQKMAKAANGNIVIATLEGVTISTNDGQSFAKPATASSGHFRQIGVSSTGTLIAERRVNNESTLMKSSDHGVTWTIVSGVDLSSGISVLSITPLESGTLAVVTTSGIYKSTDGGTSWISMKGDLEFTSNNPGDYFQASFSKIYRHPTANEYFFSNGAGLYKSIDNGTIWTKVRDTPNKISDLLWLNNKLYLAIFNDGVYESTDGGVTITAFLGHKGLALNNANELHVSDQWILYNASGGRFFESKDGGQTFAPASTTNYVDRAIVTPSRVIAYGSGISSSADGGATWINHSAGGYFHAIETNDESKFFGYRDFNATSSFVESTDLDNWTDIPTSSPISCGFPKIQVDASGAIYFVDWCKTLQVVRFGNITKVEGLDEVVNVRIISGKIYAYSTLGIIFISEDGDTWIRKPAPVGHQFYISDNGYYFIGNELTGELWLSRDEGKAWQNMGGFVGDVFQKVVVDEATGYAYAIAENRPVLKSSAVIMPNDNTVPAISTLSPADNDVNIPKDFSITITFNEPIKRVSGKKLRILASAQPTIALEVFDATAGSLSDKNRQITFTPSIAIDYLKDYFITIDNGAFTDIFGNAHAGINNATSWNFTTADEPDTQKPGISFTTSDLQAGQAKSFEITVTDNKSIAMSSPRIYYRGIATTANTAFQSTALGTSGTPLPTSTKFTVAASDSWYDKMGLEFYFEAEDVSGNKQRSPELVDTYHYSYVSYGAANPKMTGLSFGESEQSYRIISVPYKVVDGQVASLFDELGEANKDNWRLLTYAGNGAFDEYPDAYKNISRGKGYWFIQKSFNDVFIENATSPTNNRTDFFTLELKPKWNQIGNPYPVPISWNETRAGQEAVVTELKKFANGYSDGDVLEAFEGGFVYVKGTANVSLKVRFKGITSGGRITEFFDNDPASWKLDLSLNQGDRINRVASVGMHQDALTEMDAWDDLNPPPLSKKLEINLPTASGLWLAKNFVPPNATHIWPMRIEAEPGSARLSWSSVKVSENMFLLDEETQNVINMQEEDFYVFDSRGANDFRIYYGDDVEIKPTRTILSDPTPNPSSGKTRLRFTLADGGAGLVGLEIYNSVGQLVARPLQSTMAAGFHSFAWEHPDGLAPGIYFCRLRAGDQTRSKKMVIQ